MKKFKQLSVICLSVLFYCSCSDIVPLDTISKPDKCIAIPKEILLSGQDLDKRNQELFSEAKNRFLSYIEISADGICLMNKSADDIRICSDLYDFLYMKYISLPNIKTTYMSDWITKSYWEDCDSINCEEFIDTCEVDRIDDGQPNNAEVLYGWCAAVEAACYIEGDKTAAKLWHMYWFDRRTTTYTLTENEWSDVKMYCERQHEMSGGGCGAYQIDFYGAENSDLKYSYGRGTAYFDRYGHCVGFEDTYDFNSMNRSFFNESIVRILSYFSQRTGEFDIRYGNCSNQ